MMDLPSDFESERECICAVFANNDNLDTLAAVLDVDDFSDPYNRTAYALMLQLHDEQKPVDVVTLSGKLRDGGHWNEQWARTIGQMLDRVGTSSNLEHYAQRVVDKAKQRRLISAGERIAAGAYQADDVDSYAAEAMKKLGEAADSRRVTAMESLSSHARGALNDADNLMELRKGQETKGPVVTGLPTGWRDVDRMTYGWQKGDMLIVAARPSMGKSVLGLQTAMHAGYFGHKTAMFCLEMPSRQMGQRALAMTARVDLNRIRSGDLDEDDWSRLAGAADEISRCQMVVDDSAITLHEIRSACIREKRTNGLDLVVVDYLQLMDPGVPGLKSEQEQVAYISKRLKRMAKELDVVVIAVSQLNRGPEGRGDKRPNMSDLRSSGQLEQDADIVVFLYREEYYNKDCPDEERGVAEVIFAKHRNGPTGTVKLKFWGSHVRFDNRASVMDY